MPALSNTLQNKLLDWLLRAQALGLTGATAGAGSGLATVYVALFTVAPTAAGGGTEVSGNNYARAPITSSLANWSGTQGAGTTTASTGTSGAVSNNGVVTFLTPSASWGTIVDVALFDAATGGNMLPFGALTANLTVNSGIAPTIPAGGLVFSIA